MEALGEAAAATRNPVLLTEYVRQSIRRMVVKPYLNPSGDLPACFLDPAMEHAIESGIEHADQTSHLQVHPDRMRELLDRLGRALGGPDTPAVVVVGSASRHFVRQIIEGSLPNVAVLSHNEVPAGAKVISLGVIQ